MAERVVPRLVLAYLVGTEEAAKGDADRLKAVIARLEKG